MRLVSFLTGFLLFFDLILIGVGLEVEISCDVSFSMMVSSNEISALKIGKRLSASISFTVFFNILFRSLS